ncbi:MAG TPA: carboxypeptidase-like regulatory domain-containing protein [Bryobacteraceae bacterium]|nr:carboxypeptidase-like regulatory domain-containing protein [Bryobacteraceae bacterium]
MPRSSIVPALLAAALLAAAQDAGKPSAVEGVVLNAITSQPLAKAHIMLRADAGGAIRRYGAISDEQGRFSIRPIEPGKYRTAVELPGFLVAPRRTAGSGPVEIAAGGSLSGLELKMIPQGVISGRVLDADGNPMERVAVAAVRGVRRMAEQYTDAAGEFRIGGLAAGKYVVKAEPLNIEGPPEIRTDGSREERYGVTWFGGTLREQEARPVDVFAGGEVSGIEIRAIRAPVVRVSGTITGIPPAAGRVNLRHTYPSYSQDSPVAGGKFVLWGLARGPVRLSANASVGGQILVAAPLDVEVADAAIDNLDLALLPLFDLAGHVEWDGAPLPADQIHNARLRLDPLREIDNPVAAPVDPAGDFRLATAGADRYRVSIEGMPDSVFVKSVRLGTREMPDGILDVRRGAGQPLSLILSTRGAQLSGVVRDADGPVPDAAVGLVEDQPRFNTLHMVRTSPDGAYTFRGLAPGKYRLFQLDAADFDSLLQTGSLGIYEAAVEKIEIGEGDRLARDLRQ